VPHSLGTSHEGGSQGVGCPQTAQVGGPQSLWE
jgi:hypothetical protein